MTTSQPGCQWSTADSESAPTALEPLKGAHSHWHRDLSPDFGKFGAIWAGFRGQSGPGGNRAHYRGVDSDLHLLTLDIFLVIVTRTA